LADQELHVYVSKPNLVPRSKVVIEFLDGIELDVLYLLMQSYKILPTAKDYKRIGEEAGTQYRRHGEQFQFLT
jgi:phosphoribosylamine-glycine ligase